MLIILSCLLITGGELVALGELAEDQVGDPWENVEKNQGFFHGFSPWKTMGKTRENIEAPLE